MGRNLIKEPRDFYQIMKKKVVNFAIKVFRFFSQSKTISEETKRKQFILNIVLKSLILLSLSAIFHIIITTNFLKDRIALSNTSFVLVLIVFLILIFLLILSKKGKPVLSAIVLIILLLLANFQASFTWGVDLPQTIVIYSLIIVMSGILVTSNFAIILAFLITIVIIFFYFLQNSGTIRILENWRQEKTIFVDIIVLSTTYFVIAIVSWLSSREITKSLNRARKSEKNALDLAKTLQKQKNTLEIKVEARTKELKETQLKELMRINCLAEFGRISAGLLHDIKNPLTVISMNLDSLKHESKKNLKELVNKSLLASKTIEGVIRTSQKQLLYEDQKELFSLNREIKNTLSLLKHKADRNKVNLIFKPKKKFKIKSYPAKLSRVVANLVMNSIDAFEGIKRDNRFVKISTSSDSKNIQIMVKDNGCGIKEKNKKYIFQPLFSTKKDNNEKSGLGLNISQKIIQDYFKGEITFESSYGIGSSFIITISKNNKNAKHKIKH